MKGKYMSKNQSPYMLEVSSDYIRASKLLWGQPNLQNVAIVNASIAIEIILKSFLAEPYENDSLGTLAQQYKMTRSRVHLFSDLVDEIEPQLCRKLKFSKYIDWFKENDRLFIKSRYPYEPACSGSYNDTPLVVATEMFREVINWYKETGNDDPWVVLYPNVAGGCI
ncbi:hypothetical protein AKH04_11275 [Vibrio parahaemolyticus]|nr:hypothetical protein AKH04_11275 [Vibrio parahaemolyticus]